MSKIGVLGAGSWGTALALLLESNGHNITIWSIDKKEVQMLTEKREHETKLPGIKLPESIKSTDDIEQAIIDQDFLVLAVPSLFTRSTAKLMCPFVAENQIIVDVAKGIEEDTLMTLSQQIEQEIPQASVAVLSGPSHAEEVGKGLTTVVTIGAKEKEVAEYLRDAFMNERFRVYINPDVLGMELGGSLKNVVALAAGMAAGLGCGDNATAALITRGMAEITRIGLKMGGQAETFFGLTGIGDLIVTCSSVHSRNRKCGYLIGQGMTLAEAQEEVKMVVEGVYSAKAAKKLGDKYGVRTPLVDEVNRVLFENKDANVALKDLMMRDGTIEHGDLLWK